MIVTSRPNNAYAKCNYCKAEYELEYKDWKKVVCKPDPIGTTKVIPMIQCKYCKNMMVIKIED